MERQKLTRSQEATRRAADHAFLARIERAREEEIRERREEVLSSDEASQNVIDAGGF